VILGWRSAGYVRRSSSTADAPAEFEGTPQRDLAGVGEGDGSAQRLLELTDVEGPSVAKQGAGSEAIQGNAFGLGRHARQDRSDQRVEIFEAIAQCRQHHLEAGETRLEILTEPAIDAARGDGLVGRGNDPDVGLDGVVGADRADFTSISWTARPGSTCARPIRPPAVDTGLEHSDPRPHTVERGLRPDATSFLADRVLDDERAMPTQPSVPRARSGVDDQGQPFLGRNHDKRALERRRPLDCELEALVCEPRERFDAGPQAA